MNQQSADLDQIGEEILTFTVSDEALEAAAGSNSFTDTFSSKCFASCTCIFVGGCP
jgi:hypothetical protein